MKKTKLNKTATLAYYTARKQQGDVETISRLTNYSPSHITNILSGRRSISQNVANVLFTLSKSRKKNSQLV